jgi:4'-phosphopantetheinyl transferase
MRSPKPLNSAFQLRDPAQGSALLSHVLAGAVHVWYAGVEPPPWPVSTLWEVLSPTERETASNYIDPADQQASVCRRGLLRHLLSYYLGVPPQELDLMPSPLGKPALRQITGQPYIWFNTSQSGDLVAYALSRNAVGIDIQRVPASPDTTLDSEMHAMATRFFAQAERDWLATLSDKDQHVEGTYRIWTCKEAFAKAIGTGITDQLSKICVVQDRRLTSVISATPGYPARQPLHTEQWWKVHEVHSIPGCVATVVYPHTPYTTPILRVCKLAM